MRNTVALFILIFLVTSATAQVRPAFLYNESTAYGTLDLRVNISADDYYYLEEGETFSFRESAPGVRTNTYHDMTPSWDSSPYGEGHLRRKTPSGDRFVMNYRLLKPNNYTSTFAEGYPLIIMMHGSIERANCQYNDCFHADWAYDPNTNSPPAPTNVDHPLLNNDYNVNLGGKQHLDARNRAGNRLPNATDLHERAFPGFVVFPQMMNDWDSVSVENAIRIVLLHMKSYNINPNKVYIHGLSIGGHAVWEAVKRAPWLFAAALPMSAVKRGNIVLHQQVDKIAHIPFWVFQGGKDPNPTRATTLEFIDALKSKGTIVRYTEYADLGHAVWNRAYNEPDFFKFLLNRSKSHLHIKDSVLEIDAAQNIYPVLKLADGFFAYQWEKDGQLLSHESHELTITSPGKYRARFSRVANPGASDWNVWSQEIIITAKAGGEEGGGEEGGGEEGGGEEGGGEEGGGEEGGGEEGGGEEGGGEEGGGEEGGGEEGGGEEGGGEEGSGEEGGGEEGGGEEGGGEEGGGEEGGGEEGGGEEGGGEEGGGEEGGGEEEVTDVEATIDPNFEVYPNPRSTEGMIVRFAKAGKHNLQVVDAFGRVILELILIGEQATPIFKEKAIYPGMYMIAIVEGDKRHVRRVIVTDRR